MHQILFLVLTYGELELHGLEYHHQIKKNTGKKIKSAALFLHVGSVSVHVSSAPGTGLLLCVKLVVYTLCWPSILLLPPIVCMWMWLSLVLPCSRLLLLSAGSIPPLMRDRKSVV